MAISLSTCETEPFPSQDADSNIDADITQTSKKVPEEKITADDFVDPWYLDSKNNDLDKFNERFPGYGEWGATMEIRSGGEIGWYIGAIGGSGTYTIDGDYLTAELQRAIRDEFSEPEESRKRRTMAKINNRKPVYTEGEVCSEVWKPKDYS